MSTRSERGIGAELAVGLLLCGGAYFFFVAPVAEEARQVRSKAEALVAQGIGADDQHSSRPSLSEFRRCAADVALEAKELHERGRDALDEVQVLSTITAMARENGLTLEQLQPNVPASSGRPGEGAAGTLKGAGAQADQPQPDDRMTEYTLTVRGEYGRLPKFVQELTAKYPYMRVQHLRISAADEPGSRDVVAIVTTRHWAFDAGPAIRLAESACNLPE